MGACRGTTKPRGTPVGDRSPEGGRRHSSWETGIGGTGKRAGRGKPRTRQRVGKLRSGNLVSAVGREPSRRGPFGIKPSSGSKPGRRIEPSRKARRGSTGPCAVETQNLRRAIVNGRSSRGDRCAKTRRAGLTLGGTPLRKSDSGAYEGGDEGNPPQERSEARGR
jgi:hypothetical protein